MGQWDWDINNEKKHEHVRRWDLAQPGEQTKDWITQGLFLYNVRPTTMPQWEIIAHTHCKSSWTKQQNAYMHKLQFEEISKWLQWCGY